MLKSPRFSQTNKITRPNIYVQMLPDYKGWIFVDDEASEQRGKWSETFVNPQLPVDLEIGCGTGFFFEHLARANPDRNVLGIELKYKPLIQTTRRVRKFDAPNARTIRYHAALVEEVFGAGEISNCYIHFPDPWSKKKQLKHRLLTSDFFKKLHRLQKEGSWIDFKTDSADYFESVLAEKDEIPYEVTRLTRDLHQSAYASENFITGFERIFLRQGLPIHYCRFIRR